METKEFFNKKNLIAIVGVSSNSEKWGWKIYNSLKSSGFWVYSINPKYMQINGDACYPDLKSLPKKPDVVITVVSPKITEHIVEECKNLKINKVWMQPGSESEKAIIFCKSNNIDVVYNACFVVDGLKNKVDD
ncbi:MAG: CoA-binding protein [Candidatus Aenigmarchaeota archaeon]|nr:CoA-binding protein [Candidatus Aenigmarchaeota archaeon]